MKPVNEISTNRILTHLKDGGTFAIISTFRPDRVENDEMATLKMNMKLLRDLKQKCREKNYGFSEFISRWSEQDSETGEVNSSDERALMIFGIPENEALELGQDYNQSSIIFNDKNGCREICTNQFADWETGHVYKPGDTVREFKTQGKDILNIDDAREIFQKKRGGPASMPVKGTQRPFHLSEAYMLEKPRPSYFQRTGSFMPIYCESDEKISPLISHWAELAKQDRDFGFGW